MWNDGVLQENNAVQTTRSFSTNTQFERKQLIRKYFTLFSNQENFEILLQNTHKKYEKQTDLENFYNV